MDVPKMAQKHLSELRLNAQLATIVMFTNPGSVTEFYWGNPGGEKREFIALSSCLTLPCISFC